MKRLAICIFALTLAISAFATGQDGDIVIIDGEEWSLLAKPIYADTLLSKGLKTALPKERTVITSNWSGYTAYWSIKNEKMCLDSITVMSSGNGTIRMPEADIRRVFKDYCDEDNIVATWITGDLRAARGKVLYYEHSGFERNQEYEQILKVNQGKVTGRQTFHNRVAVDGFSLKGLEAQLRKKDRKEIRAIFPLHIENYPELADVKRIVFSVSNIKVDSLGNLLDCRVTAKIWQQDEPQEVERLAQEMKELLKNIRPWKTLFINGEYFVEERYGFTFPYILS